MLERIAHQYSFVELCFVIQSTPKKIFSIIYGSPMNLCSTPFVIFFYCFLFYVISFICIISPFRVLSSALFRCKASACSMMQRRNFFDSLSCWILTGWAQGFGAFAIPSPIFSTGESVDILHSLPIGLFSLCLIPSFIICF